MCLIHAERRMQKQRLRQPRGYRMGFRNIQRPRSSDSLFRKLLLNWNEDPAVIHLLHVTKVWWERMWLSHLEPPSAALPKQSTDWAGGLTDCPKSGLFSKESMQPQESGTTQSSAWPLLLMDSAHSHEWFKTQLNSYEAFGGIFQMFSLHLSYVLPSHAASVCPYDLEYIDYSHIF